MWHNFVDNRYFWKYLSQRLVCISWDFLEHWLHLEVEIYTRIIWKMSNCSFLQANYSTFWVINDNFSVYISLVLFRFRYKQRETLVPLYKGILSSRGSHEKGSECNLTPQSRKMCQNNWWTKKWIIDKLFPKNKWEALLTSFWKVICKKLA